MTFLFVIISLFIKWEILNINFNRLENFQEFIIEKNIRLLIIDSFGALIKKEFIGKKDSLDKRSRLLVKFAAWLK